MKKINKDTFIKNYCEKSKVTEEELLKSQIALECNCDDKDCQGWAVVSNNEASIKAHNELYK